MLNAPEDGPLRIGEFARRVGVSAELLRAWERRYGLLAPIRSAGGYRLYTAADAERVARMRRGLESGMSAAQAAEAARVGGHTSSSPAVLAGQLEEGSPGQAIQRVLDAVREFDEAGLHEALDVSLAAFGLEQVLRGLVLPALVEIGVLWERGEMDISHEHFASTIIRGRLLALARLWGRGEGRLALLACLPGEAHDIGLICFGLLLRSHGWRILFLGADTPVSTMIHVARLTRPALTVAVSFSSERFVAQAQELAELGELTALRLAGPGAAASAGRDVGASRLESDIFQAVASAAA